MSETSLKVGVIESDDEIDITTSEKSTVLRGRPIAPRRRQSTATGSRSTSARSLKKSPMEEQAFLSTLPIRIKNRRLRTSTNTSKSDLAIMDPAVPDLPDHDSDATSSEDERGALRKAKKPDGTMAPTMGSNATGFVALSCGKDAPNVHYVSPIKENAEGVSRPDLVDGSRFYVKRRIKIGNTSKFIPECITPMVLLTIAKRSPKMAKYTHKWMIYFVSPPYVWSSIVV
jgi:hypothetical protein